MRSGIIPRKIWNLISSWVGVLILSLLILFYAAPASWWQFGVTEVSSRRQGADFSLKTIDEVAWKFADHRDKVVLVNYWATWCPPCRIETPGLVSLANEYAGRGVSVVGVSVDEDVGLIPPFIEKYQIKYPILVAGLDPNLPPDGFALPTTFLYDKKGRIAKRYTGIVLESTFRSDIESLLAEN